MKDSKNNRCRRLHVRFTNAEFEKLQSHFARSAYPRISDYARKILLQKPVKITQRNQSLDDFMAELIALRQELNAIGNNYNQVVKRLHMLDDFPEIKSWLILNETARKILLDKVSEIKLKISQINDVWLVS